MSFACQVLGLVPVSLGFASCLGKLGQVNTLQLADHAVSARAPVLGLRLYDFYLTRFALSRHCDNVLDSVARLLAALPASEPHAAALGAFLAYHPESQLAGRIGAWLNNARQSAADASPAGATA